MIDGYTYKRLEQELEVLRMENKTLKQNLSKAVRILKNIKKLLMERRSAKK